MTVTSSSNTSQIYASNKTTKVKAASAYENTATISTQKIDKMAEMQEKYKDIYTPIPETYSQADEDLQAQKIYEAYPNYVSTQDVLKKAHDIYIEELDGEPIQPGSTLTQDQLEKNTLATQKAYDFYGGKEAVEKVQQDVQKIKDQYPINKWAKSGVSNAGELARFYNAAVYEGLENGKSLSEAKHSASESMMKSMDITGIVKSIKETWDTKFGITSEIQWDNTTYEERTAKINSDDSINLKDYGFRQGYKIIQVHYNDNAMTSSLQRTLDMYDFMLNNPDIIEKKVNQFNTDHTIQENTSTQNIYENIESQYDTAQLAFKVFSQYKIYDSVDTKA